MEIDGTVCIVTGASSGIGAATARLLSQMGARVVLAARRTERLEALSSELPGSLAVTTDVTVTEDLDRLVARTIETYGTVDVLVNNAGQGLHVPLEELDPVDFRAVFDLNVVASLVAMQCVLPHMRAGSGGVIVNVSSATSLRVFAGLGGYSATKSALNMLSQVGRVEFAPAGITVSRRLPVRHRHRVPPAPAGRPPGHGRALHRPRPARARGPGHRHGHLDGRAPRPRRRSAQGDRARGQRGLGRPARPSGPPCGPPVGRTRLEPGVTTHPEGTRDRPR